MTLCPEYVSIIRGSIETLTQYKLFVTLMNHNVIVNDFTKTYNTVFTIIWLTFIPSCLRYAKALMCLFFQKKHVLL